MTSNEWEPRLRALAEEFAGHWEYDETSDGDGTAVGAENAAYNAAGARLHDLLDELTGVPRCRHCGGFLRMFGEFWFSRGDLRPGLCIPSPTSAHVPKDV